MQLKQPGLSYSVCGPFTKNKERIQKFKETEIQNIFTEMNQINFVFNMIWPFTEVLRIYKEEQLQMINKGLRVKAFVIAKNKKI